MLLVLFCVYLLAHCQGFVAEVSLEQLQIDFIQTKNEMNQLKQTVQTLQQQLNDTGKLAAQAAAASTSSHAPIAFTAHLTTTIAALGPHQQIAFDNVVTNVGGAYSKTSGHFTAPVFGVYAFFVTATNTPGHSTSLSLMKNGQAVAFTLAHGTSATPGQWETSTLPAVLTLNAGDSVWAQNENAFSTVEQLDGYNYSSFSGFLVNSL